MEIWHLTWTIATYDISIDISRPEELVAVVIIFMTTSDEVSIKHIIFNHKQPATVNNNEAAMVFRYNTEHSD